MTIPQNVVHDILQIADDILREMEGDPDASVMTVHGPVSPSYARKMLSERYGKPVKVMP